MSDAFEHNPGDHEDPLPGPTWIVGILGVVLLAVIILGITALFYDAEHHEDQKKIVQRDPMELVNLRAQQKGQLEGSRWVEEMTKDEKGNDVKGKALVIPIDQAMQILVKEAAKN